MFFPCFLPLSEEDFERSPNEMKLPKSFFSGTEKDQEAGESGQGATRDPTSPHGAARGGGRPLACGLPEAPLP